MKKLIYTTALMLAVILASPAIATTETHCTGDAARSTPPVVNNPTHIRDVVWKNMRAICLQELAQVTSNKPPLSHPAETAPSTVPIQPQKHL
jgi:hypothetical protein